ncbi:MAG TPA: DinB family protein [Anaerolineales bacterium]|nr:DinB family protein [Anaerolineales bacterium]
MYNSTGDLLDALKATPDTLTALLKGVSQKQAQTARGGDENWSVVEVLCHLRDAEEFFIKRMQAMRDQEDPAIIGYDQEALARERNYKAADLQKALAGFLSFRQQAVAEFSKLSPEQWQRTGRHNEMGEITIFGQAIHHAAHDAIHCAQIARQLGSK